MVALLRSQSRRPTLRVRPEGIEFHWLLRVSTMVDFLVHDEAWFLRSVKPVNDA